MPPPLPRAPQQRAVAQAAPPLAVELDVSMSRCPPSGANKDLEREEGWRMSEVEAMKGLGSGEFVLPCII